MKHVISYKNYLIHSESFQLPPRGAWIPRFVLQSSNLAADDSPLHRDRLDQAFGSESEADDFAVQDAKLWIDTQ